MSGKLPEACLCAASGSEHWLQLPVSSQFVVLGFANGLLTLSPTLCWEKLFQLFAHKQLSGSVFFSQDMLLQ